jgi:virginiamycin B lyase
VTGSDGALWFTNAGPYASAINIIGRYSPATGFRSFPVSAGSRPYEIAAGPDGALWFTEAGTNRIGRITTAGAYTEYPLPPGYAYPGAITRGPDNALWFLIGAGAPFTIGEITTAGSISLTPVPSAYFPTGDMASTPDGSLWFGSQAGVVHFTP